MSGNWLVLGHATKMNQAAALAQVGLLGQAMIFATSACTR